MPINDFLSLTDDGLRAKYEAKPVDKAAIRKPLVKALKTAIEQFNTGRTKAPNRMWTANGDTVKFTPKLRGEPLAISGKTEHFIPSERFVEAVNLLIANVEAGELDDLLGSEASTKSASKRFPAARATSSDPLTNIRRAFGIRMGKQKQTAAQAAAALKADGKYDAADIDKVLAEKK
ncbi:hypothetical protein N6H05_23750 [Sphingobium sp. WTD-1]|uniref:hypothetical protein n=1 Tax=Sphingobium sp. WTD-1 TaxID=2979467 RepID=UPI0024DE5A5C|nr:hypothetical protein [Sphingobium sp. WTD-1]WIA55994.1 hypothetical protein N6H05_23750 [Sphingobium sp. WTD-1]